MILRMIIILELRIDKQKINCYCKLLNFNISEKSLIRKPLNIILLITSIMLLTEPAFAAPKKEEGDEENVYSFDTVTVTAAKTTQNSFEMPAMTSTINMDDPAVAPASTLADIFRDEPFVQFTGSARRNGQTPTIRGFDEDSIVTLVDGVRQNFQSEHDGTFFIDPSVVKRVEVLRGPNSTLYGSGGLGGVISFEVKDAADYLKNGENYGAEFNTGYQSASKEIFNSLTGYATDESKKWDALVNVAKRDSKNIDLGDDSELPSEDDVFSSLTKFKYFANDANTLGFSFQSYNNNSKEPNNPQIGFAGPTGELVDKDTSSYTTKVTHEFDDYDIDLFKLKTQLYHTQTTVGETVVDDTDVNNPGDLLTRELNTYGLNLDGRTLVKQETNFPNTISYGLEAYTDTQDGADSRNGERGGVPDAEDEFIGVYLQSELKLKPEMIYGEIVLTPGGRFDTYRSHSASGNMNESQAFSPKFSASYKPIGWFMTYASYAEAFRAPNLTEIYSTGFHFAVSGLGVNVFTPNPNLRPEKSATKEVGFGFDFYDVMAEEDNLTFKMARYFTDSEDYIDQQVNFVFSPCCGTTDTVNVPNAKLSGTEVELGYKVGRIDFSSAYTHIDGRNVDTGAFLGTLTPDTLTTRIGYNIEELDSQIGYRVTGVEGHDRVIASGDIREGYTVHDVYYQWTPQEIENFTLNLGIDNIYDKAYATVFPGSLDPGRNYKVLGKYSW